MGGRALDAYFEAHIEQGPILEREDKIVGVVTGALGLRWYDCVWTGQDAHAGPTPMEARHDALRGAARFVEAINALALRHALSAKVKDGGLIVIESATLEAAKTKALVGHFSGLGLTNALIIDGAEVHNGFAAAARNIPNIDVLPVQGINVYDILRRQKLVLTKAALDALEARFK